MPAAGTSRIHAIGAGCISGLVLGSAFAAGPPVAYDQYNVNSGDITSGASLTDCSSLIVPGAPLATVTCSDVLVDDGMMQRKLSVSGAGPGLNGDYIQFVVVDPGTTGNPAADPFTAGRGNLTFTNEDFVKQRNRQGGIASKQTIVEATMNGSLEDRFATSVEYNWGWAGGVADPWVQVTQDLSQVDYTNPLSPEELFSQNFMVENNSPPLNWKTNEKVQINQAVDLSNGGGKGVQGFKFAKVSGIYQPSNLAALQFLTGGDLLPGGTNGGNPAYAFGSGDELQALWIGQWLEDGNGGGETFFGLTRYSGIHPSTGNDFPTQLVSFNDTTAVNWANIDAAYTGFYGAGRGIGSAPSLPAIPSGVPIIVAATDSSFYASPDAIAPTVAAGSAPSGSTTPVDLPLSAYNDWQVSGGVFYSVGCSGTGTVVCSDPVVNEGGVYQRVVSVNGVQYYQTVVTDPNATGDPGVPDFDPNYLAFKTESFVKVGSTAQEGIAANLHIAEADTGYVGNTGSLPSSGGQFTYNTQLKTGWANGGPLDPRVTVDQRLLVPEDGYPQYVSSLDYDFHMMQGQTPLDKVIYFSDAVGTETNSTWGSPSFNIGSPIMFATAKVTGVFQDTGHLAGPDLLSTGDITWSPYDAIQATWVGGAYTTSDPFGQSIVSTTSYTNLSTGDRIAATDISSTPPNPETWFSPFDTYLNPAYSASYVPPGY